MQDIKILFEDQYIIVAEKPAGMLSYPLPGSDEKTIGDILGALPVHRLDRDTSGVLVLAKDENTKEAMQKLFSDRKIEKKYITLVWGKIEPKTGEIKIPLGRGAKDRLKVVPSASGRDSHTIYEVSHYYPDSDVSLLAIDLMTGRTHQIRVHMSAIGHPVVGDMKYSNKESGLPRQFLHAKSIAFEHPITGQKVAVASELPDDLKNYLDTLK
jgi:23S rRNA pseudouridine1911/1915/1917 synthase